MPVKHTVESVIRDILAQKTIAVVGMSRNPRKAAHRVPKYLLEHGYRIIPVNPAAEEILGLKSYPTLLDIPDEIDVVNVFRPSREVSGIVDDAINVGAKAVWTQLGIADEKAAAKAREAGLKVVMNRCMRTEHTRRFRREGVSH